MHVFLNLDEKKGPPFPAAQGRDPEIESNRFAKPGRESSSS